jgi:type IV pilus assembly protein PilC
LALSALLDDLTDRGRLEETLVVVMGEFGRTPKVSTAGGRDHWPRVFCVLLAGGGVSGGQVIGSSDATGESPKDRPVTPADLAATIYTLLGIDPLSTLTTSDGRPVQISRDGKPLPKLVSRLTSFNNRSGSRSMEQMARISTGSLIKLCHRVGTAVRSGIDARRVWEMEERHASGSLKSALGVVKSRVSEGGMIAEAMHSQNGYFPPMFVQMVAVGEQTGKLDEVLLRLAEHYEHQTSMKRIFWFGIAWPLLQLVAAILVIGLVIYITGIIADTRGGEALDLLGWGLTGTSGAIIWFLGCGFIAFAIAALSFAISRGLFGPGPVLAAMRIPVIGKCLESFALSRLTWASPWLDVEWTPARGRTRSERARIRTTSHRHKSPPDPRQQFRSFADAGVFPSDFLQQLEAAELAGATTEALLRLAKEYEDRARTSVKIITGIATAAVWILAGMIMIYFIFTLFYHVYYKPIQDALDMLEPGNL